MVIKSIIVATYTCLAIVSFNVSAVSVSGQGTWETTLQGRDLDGDLSTAEAWYDTVLEITWLADVAYGFNTSYDRWGSGLVYIDGYMTWYKANDWVASLDPYGSGIIGWRLPSTDPVDGISVGNFTDYSNIGSEDRGYNISAPGTLYAGSTASELAHMFYNTLGNLGKCDSVTSTDSTCVEQPGWGLSNAGPFNHLSSAPGPTPGVGTTGSAGIWSGTKIENSNQGWFLDFSSGLQYTAFVAPDNSTSSLAWAVHDDDVGVDCTMYGCITVETDFPVLEIPSIPIPAAFWLFGSGLLGLIGAAMRKNYA